LLESPVIPMIEAHTDANVVFGGKLRQAKQLIDVSCRRLLDQNVDSGVDGSTRNLDLRVLRRCYDDCANVGATQQLAPVSAGNAALTEGRYLRCACQICIDAMDQPSACQMLSPLSADCATPDNTDVQSESPQLMPRSVGTMRRKV
jgi:hypothetical protein